MSKIIVTVKHTIPLMDFGNIIYEVAQEIEMGEPSPQELGFATENALASLKTSLSETILPLVNSEVERCMSVLTQDSEPDKWMRKNSKVYQWFRLAYPDVDIPAMGKIEQEKEAEFRARYPLRDLETVNQ